jgi:hypothetical protein
MEEEVQEEASSQRFLHSFFTLKRVQKQRGFFETPISGPASTASGPGDDAGKVEDRPAMAVSSDPAKPRQHLQFSSKIQANTGFAGVKTLENGQSKLQTEAPSWLTGTTCRPSHQVTFTFEGDNEGRRGGARGEQSEAWTSEEVQEAK